MNGSSRSDISPESEDLEGGKTSLKDLPATPEEYLHVGELLAICSAFAVFAMLCYAVVERRRRRARWANAWRAGGKADAMIINKASHARAARKAKAKELRPSVVSTPSSAWMSTPSERMSTPSSDARVSTASESVGLSIAPESFLQAKGDETPRYAKMSPLYRRPEPDGPNRRSAQDDNQSEKAKKKKSGPTSPPPTSPRPTSRGRGGEEKGPGRTLGGGDEKKVKKSLHGVRKKPLAKTRGKSRTVK